MASTLFTNPEPSYMPDPDDNVMDSIFKQYERTIVESLITAFGLDFLVNDRHGGDVDTIHNVRQIDKDPSMEYKNSANKADYDNRGAYNSREYHSDKRYIEKNKQVSAQKKPEYYEMNILVGLWLETEKPI